MVGHGNAAGDLPKAYLPLRGEPMVAHSLRALAGLPGMQYLVVVHHPDDLELALPLRDLDPRVRLVVGGTHRAASVARGLAALAAEVPDLVLIHDAARPLLRLALLNRLLDALDQNAELDGVCPATPLVDALKQLDGAGQLQPLDLGDRSRLKLVQTPQVFRFARLWPLYQPVDALPEAADDMAVAAGGGLRLGWVQGDPDNLKITYAEDLPRAEQLMTAKKHYRVGQGIDVHGWAPPEDGAGGGLRLAGVAIPHPQSLDGHSDADVALHALMDAILGALALGDIGQHFPSNDQRFKGADSTQLLAHVLQLMRGQGGQLVNIDLTVVGEAPKIAPYRDAMRESLSKLTDLSLSAISIKATTTDRLGFLGRGEGLACFAVVGLELNYDEN
jgi:2-C-methyl-D-erythritol 4-phosphate cytidylyltransferase/2-C-methyl-D-erythritol 2,4-cyclodiphosphate synthase